MSKSNNEPPNGMSLLEAGLWEVPGMSCPINLITVAQLRLLPDGTELWSIAGEYLVTGRDKIDEDTRGGFTAVGFKRPDIPLKKDQKMSGVIRRIILSKLKKFRS